MTIERKERRKGGNGFYFVLNYDPQPGSEVNGGRSRKDDPGKEHRRRKEPSKGSSAASREKGTRREGDVFSKTSGMSMVDGGKRLCVINSPREDDL